MTIPGHLSVGYLALKTIEEINPNFLQTNLILIAGLTGALLPDLDAFFFKYLKDHHKSYLHAPIFWILIFIPLLTIVGIFQNSWVISILIALFAGVFSHLLADWFTGRTTGIRIFYPFSMKDYSLYRLNPGKGEIPITFIPSKNQLKFYSENAFLLFVELTAIFAALILIVLKR